MAKPLTAKQARAMVIRRLRDLAYRIERGYGSGMTVEWHVPAPSDEPPIVETLRVTVTL